METRGWSGIEYNFLAYSDGTMYKVRPIGVVPACVEGHNIESICSCFVGDFSASSPTPEALAVSAWLVGLLRQSYTQIEGVRGRVEMPGQTTSCPGGAFNLISYRTQLGMPA